MLWLSLLSQPHPSHGSVLPKAALKNGAGKLLQVILCFNLKTHVPYENKEEIQEQAKYHVFNKAGEI